jgi:hypothetical protein
MEAAAIETLLETGIDPGVFGDQHPQGEQEHSRQFEFARAGQ